MTSDEKWVQSQEPISRLSHDRGAEALAPARAGGRRHLTFDNGRSEDYHAVFVQHEPSGGEWDRILIARDDGTIAALLADLINGAALSVPAPTLPALDVAVVALAFARLNYGKDARAVGDDIAWAKAFIREYEALRDAV